MAYYMTTTLASGEFEDVVRRVIEELKRENFVIVAEIDVKDVLWNELNAEFRNYKVIQACNPMFVLDGLQMANKVRSILPSSFVVQELGNGRVEVAAVNPVASMQMPDDPSLKQVARACRAKLKGVIERL